MARARAGLTFPRFREAGALALLAGVVAVAGAIEPRFLEAQSLNAVLLALPILVVGAIGQMAVIVSKGVDVSIGSTLGLSAMVGGIVFREYPGVSPVAGIAVCAFGGLALGCLNGLLVVRFAVPPILATLGTLSAYRGLTFIASRGEQIDSNHIPESLARLAQDGPFAIAGVTLYWALLASLLVAVLAHVVLTRTRAGIHLYAVGGHDEGARLSGVSVGGVRFSAFALCGLLAGLAGALYMARFRVVNPATAGQGFELTAIAAAVIGGTNIAGGSGTVPGVVLGCALLATINVALAVLGIAATWQLAAYGVVILVALLSESAVRNREGAERP